MPSPPGTVTIHCGCGISHAFPLSSIGQCACGRRWQINPPGSPWFVTPLAPLSRGELPELPAPPAPDPPKLTAKVIGFRAWSFEGYRLKSRAGEWSIGVNVAECKRDVFEGASFCLPSSTHVAPEHLCTCGLHALYEAEHSLMLGPGSAYGAVTAWGRIEVHVAGFRAQYAEPVVLAYVEDQPYKHVRDLKAIASEMGVECVPVHELAREAAKHGEPMPEELRPTHPTIPPSALRPFAGIGMAGSIAAVPMRFATAPMMSGGQIAPPPPKPMPSRAARLAAVVGMSLNLPFFAVNLAVGIADGTAINLAVAAVNLTAGLYCWRRWRQLLQQLQ